MNRNITIGILVLNVCLFLTACSDKKTVEEVQPVTMTEQESESTMEDNDEPDDAAEISAPSKAEVLTMRELVLEGMTDDEIERLTENIKVANLRMESAYLSDDIFEKLSDKDSLYWNYFDQKGDIQTGWSYDGTISDIKAIMKKEGLTQSEFYQKYGEPVILDYFLLRYGIEDVGKYTTDGSIVSKYYGVLNVYQE